MKLNMYTKPNNKCQFSTFQFKTFTTKCQYYYLKTYCNRYAVYCTISPLYECDDESTMYDKQLMDNQRSLLLKNVGNIRKLTK